MRTMNSMFHQTYMEVSPRDLPGVMGWKFYSVVVAGWCYEEYFYIPNTEQVVRVCNTRDKPRWYREVEAIWSDYELRHDMPRNEHERVLTQTWRLLLWWLTPKVITEESSWTNML